MHLGGINSFLKNISTPDEFINKFMDFLEVVTTKINPDMMVTCKIPPILDNHDANVNADEFNRAVSEHIGSGAGFEVLNLKSLMKDVKEYRFKVFGTRSTLNIIAASLSYIFVCQLSFVNTLVVTTLMILHPRPKLSIKRPFGIINTRISTTILILVNFE